MTLSTTLAAGAILSAAMLPGARTYHVDASASRIGIHVGRAGLFKFAGHAHEVVTTSIEGLVVADAENLAASRVSLRFPMDGLRVSADGEPAGDVPKVQAKMEGPDVLDVGRFPEATFTSHVVGGRKTAAGCALTVEGDFTLRGLTRKLEVPVEVSVEDDVLTATGTTVLWHDDFGMTPVSVAGVVKVKNEIRVLFRIVARASPPSP